MMDEIIAYYSSEGINRTILNLPSIRQGVHARLSQIVIRLDGNRADLWVWDRNLNRYVLMKTS